MTDKKTNLRLKGIVMTCVSAMLFGITPVQ